MGGNRTRRRGELEGEALAILRDADGLMSAAEIQAAFAPPIPAHTTILTAVNRLIDKGEVVRHSGAARRVRFTARQSAEESASASMYRALEGATDRRAALLQFAGNLDPADVEMLRAAMAKRSST